MASLWGELRRRNVVRVGVAYAIVAWLLIQITGTVFPALKLPEWTVTFVTALLIISFPIVLIVAWAFEVTPEGVRRSREVPLEQSVKRITGRKFNFAIIGLLALALAFVVVDNYVLRDEPTPVVSEQTVQTVDKSIAVLPFANRSANEEDAFFVDGLHDDLLTHISKIGSIKTISRTSVMQYRDTTKTMRDIGEELGVATVLEGSVQRAGNQIRVNVQLINTSTDEHIWAEIYDRELTAGNVFAIQGDIAMAVSEALQATLSADEKERLASVPTENMAALEAYFRGQQLLEQRSTLALAQAVDYFGEAMDLDPDFALAYVGLANGWLLQTVYSNFPQDEFYPKAKPMVETALQLDEGLGEAYTTLAVIKEIYDHDLAAADSAYRRALELSPNYATAHLWYGNFNGRFGRVEEALVHYENAVRVDPRSPIMNFNLADGLRELGQFDQALLQFEKIIEIDPGFYLAYRAIGDIERFAFGRLHEAVARYKQSLDRDPESPHLNTWLGLLYLDLGDDVSAEYWIQRAQQQGLESFDANVAMGILQTYRGDMGSALEYASKTEDMDFTNPYQALLAWQLRSSVSSHDLQQGRYASARARYGRRFPELLIDTDPQVSRSNYRSAIDLAHILQKTGEHDQANMLLEHCLDLISSMPRLGQFGHGISDVQIYALKGRAEDALRALRSAVQEGWRHFWWYHAEHDHVLESIRHEPEFQKMMGEIRGDMVEQLARVHEREASGE